MRLLVIGGTRFVGRHIAAAAIARGHAVTLFNRGLSAGPELFPEAEHVRGDRHAGGLAALAGRRFDAIVDSSAYFPADVSAAAAVAADRYLFVSSGSVYREPVLAGSDESAPVIELRRAVPETIVSAEDYGGLKVLCERVASERFPGAAVVLRCGLVVGPGDPTERFAYWPRRVARGGEVLAAEPDQPVQFIDARDLGAWAVALLEAGTIGVFNTVGRPAADHGGSAARVRGRERLGRVARLGGRPRSSSTTASSPGPTSRSGSRPTSRASSPSTPRPPRPPACAPARCATRSPTSCAGTRPATRPSAAMLEPERERDLLASSGSRRTSARALSSCSTYGRAARQSIRQGCVSSPRACRPRAQRGRILATLRVPRRRSSAGRALHS